MEPIRNPVTGVGDFPRLSLPQGFVYQDQESNRVSTTSFVVRSELRMESRGTDAAYSPFEYRGP